MTATQVLAASPEAAGAPGETSAERIGFFMDFTGRTVVVVGGGEVALRKVRSLLAAGARPVLVAPAATAALVELAAAGALRWEQRAYVPADVDGTWLAVAATDDARVNAAVVADAEAARVWALNCSEAVTSPVWGAVQLAGEDGVAVAVSGGGDPCRGQAVAANISAAIDAGALPNRRVRAGGVGRVYLVGGGPGQEDLMTVRARRLLATADVVVMDRLAPWSALATLDPGVEVINVGKAPGHHVRTQTQINEVIVARALAGKVVVRLKGGDPFVLGRGGEEALACAAAGVPVEVVPGVTSAIAVPAAAGIPVTHRGVASSFAMISAHSAAEALDHARGTTADTTLVFLMGVATLAEVARGLIAAGRSSDTAVAIVERGWQPGQRTTVGTLADIADRAVRAGVQSPAVVVVGDVVHVGAQIAPALMGAATPTAAAPPTRTPTYALQETS